MAELEIIRALAERDVAVDVLTYSEGVDVEVPGATIHRIRRIPFLRPIRPGFSVGKVVSDLLLAVAAYRMMRRTRYDLVHAVEESAFIALVLGRLNGTPFVYDMDSSMPRQMADEYRVVRPFLPALLKMEGLLVRRSLAVLTMCRTLEERARSHSPEALVGRVEDMALAGEERGEDRLSDLTSGAPAVLYVGNLMPYQGVDLLLDAFRLVVDAGSDAHLVIVGGANRRRDHYTARAASKGLAERVHLIGPRPVAQLGYYLQQATVLVSPRVHGTNTPMKLYSYLDSGVPVLATRLLTHTQVLDDTQAMLCEPTPESMAGGLLELLRDPDLRARLAASARELVAREFTPASHRRKLNRFYDAVEARLDNGRTPRHVHVEAG